MSQDQLLEYIQYTCSSVGKTSDQLLSCLLTFLSFKLVISSQRSELINLSQMTLKHIITLGQFCTDGLFHALIIDCQGSWLACRSQGEVVARSHDDNWDHNHSQWVCVCTVAIALNLGGGGLPAVTGAFDWLMPDARWWMRTRIKPSDGHAEAPAV